MTNYVVLSAQFIAYINAICDHESELYFVAMDAIYVLPNLGFLDNIFTFSFQRTFQSPNTFFDSARGSVSN